MLSVSTYQGVNGVSFGSNEAAVVSALGHPLERRTDHQGGVELRYACFTARINGEPARFTELTLLPNCEASVNGLRVVWAPVLLQTILKMDPALVEVLGFIVSLKLGIALSGFHDGDQCQMAIHVFREGEWDCFRSKMKPFRPHLYAPSLQSPRQCGHTTIWRTF
jgi:hypothetical protein